MRKGSDVVDLTCVRKANAAGSSDVANIWELPGIEALADCLSVKYKAAVGPPIPAFFLPAKSLNAAVVIIVVDLSKPWTVVDTCNKWLERTRAALNEQFHLLEKRGSPLPTQLRVRCSHPCIPCSTRFGYLVCMSSCRRKSYTHRTVMVPSGL